MKLAAWRGNNVLITDRVGDPVLTMNRMGNVVEAAGAVECDDLFDSDSSEEGLARSVATWIEWTADEAGEFCGADIHPQIRDLVVALAPCFVD